MKIIEKDFNVVTGEETIIDREETAAEAKARLDHAKAVAEAQAVAEAKAKARATLLARLGITEEEAQLLLG